MKLTGYIDPVVLTEEEHVWMQETAKSVHEVINQLSIRKYGEVRYAELKRAIIAGKFTDLTTEEKAAINNLERMDKMALPGFVLVAVKLSRTFERSKVNSMTYWDFFQESVMKISDCIFPYDGSTRFNTYVTNAIYRHLLNKVRTDQYLKAAAAGTMEKYDEVLDLVKDKEISFEDAAKQLGCSDRTIETLTSIAGANVMVFSQMRKAEGAEHRNSDFSAFIADNSKQTVNLFEYGIDNVGELIQSAELSDFESTLLTAYLQSEDTGFRTEIAKQFKKTRAAASQALIRALNKIKAVYFARHPELLAA